LNGGILAPGNSAGTLTFTEGSLVLSNSAVLNFELGTNSDLVACSNLTMGGTVNVADAGGFGPGTNTLFTYTGILTDNGLTVNNPLPGGNTGTIDTNTAGQVNLIVTIGGSPPVASFNASTTNGVAPLTVNFTDTSTGAPTDWFWDFGGAGTSTNQNPSLSFAAGNWSVSLIASNASGASSPYTTNITVITPQQSWQNFYGVPADASDPLGKGISNYDQFLAGFNPTNPAAYPHVMSVASSNDTDMVIIYLGANGDISYAGGPSSRTNVLEFTAGDFTTNFLSTGLSQVLSNGTGNGAVSTITDTGGATNTPSRYYRVRVLTP
jgi:PKD repeat protein